MRKTGTDVPKNQRVMSKLKEEVERAKRTLSSRMPTKLDIQLFESEEDFPDTLTRAKFEELRIEFFQKTMKPVEQALKDSGVKEDVSDVRGAPFHFVLASNQHLISQIVLVGASTRISIIPALIKKHVGKELSKETGIQSGMLSGEEGVEDVVPTDICPLAMSVESTGGAFTRLILRNTIVPTKKSQIQSAAAGNQPTVMIQVSLTPLISSALY